VNLTGTMRMMRAVLPHMLARGGGSIVNIASVAAFNAGADSASYAASKAGVVALTRSAAQACGARGVRANALCPGWVDTPMAAREMQDLANELGITEQQARQRTVARIALGRMASADEMAAVCLFLASDDASFVTGTALIADGGARRAAA
jgi:NAD(P)-dependent dehydrogenase (short-subunit alcohol dehydrogenase family)